MSPLGSEKVVSGLGRPVSPLGSEEVVSGLGRPVSPLGSEEVVSVGLAAGLDAVGVARAERFESVRDVLVKRRDQGLHGGMAFTYRNPDRSTDPARVVDGARSLVVGALGYRRPTPEPPDRAVGRVAAYARRDHYDELRKALGRVAAVLGTAGHQAVVVADDNALVDREAARRAGLGWYGKNSNILLPGRGSWFVLGTVITTAELAPSDPVPDQCGPCRRCLEGCPTGAIVAPGVVDARRCLAWLVQAAGDFPLEYREALGNRIYGCDDCQEVCPPNRSAGDAGAAAAVGANPDGDVAWGSGVAAVGTDAGSPGPDGDVAWGSGVAAVGTDAGSPGPDGDVAWGSGVAAVGTDAGSPGSDEDVAWGSGVAAVGANPDEDVADGRDVAWVDLVELLGLDDARLMARYGRWYIPRREPRYVRRNALVALGNSGRGSDPEVAGVVLRYLADPDPMLVRHAAWAARRLGVDAAAPV